MRKEKRMQTQQSSAGTIVVACRVTADERKRLTAIAQQQQQTMSQLIRTALAEKMIPNKQ
jgi:hypothetical protein